MAPHTRTPSLVLAASAASLAALLATSARADPSFDCARATTPTERLVCRDAALASLDTQLAAAYQAALARDPARRAALLAAQRAWLSWRDTTCRAEAACVARAYRDRIQELASNPDGAATPLCRATAERYEAWRKRTGPGADDGRGPLALAGVRDSGVKVVSDPVAVLDEGAKLEAWARGRHPPLTLPRELVASVLDSAEHERVTIEKLPGVEYYAATSIQGTAHCYYSSFFTIDAGRAQVAPRPTNWDDAEGSSCAGTRAFGTVDGVPVAFESGAGESMLEETLTLSPWSGGRFGPACGIVLRYAPRFSSTADPDDGDEVCTGPACAALRSAAVALVTEVQASPANALRRALEKLSPEQRAAFAKAPRDEATSKATIDADALTEQVPLAVPIVVGGKLYRATAGHSTLGWRVYPDWRVTFAELPGGSPSASLAIGMGRGPIVSATVR